MSTNEHSRREELILFLLIVAATLAIYCKSLSYGFLNTWDDPAYVVKNAAAHGFSLEHVKIAFSRFFVGNYAPLHIVSYMVDYSLWGLNPGGYIFGNICLHACNGYLLTVLFRRLAGGFYPSILAAGLFILHPVQVESVVWISQRKNVLAMLFFLLALFFYSVYRSSSGAAARTRYLLALFFCVCALLTKSIAVVLPPILLLYDICITRRKLRESLLDKLPFVFFALLTGYIAMLSQSYEYGGGGRTASPGGSAWSTLLTMLPVLVAYLKIIIAPFDLSIVYAPQIRSALDAHVIIAMLVLCLLLAGGVLLFKRDKTAFFWYAFIPLAILPVAQIVPLVTLMNDRYLYFPMLGVASCFGLLAGHLHNTVAVTWRKGLYVLLSIIVALYGFTAMQRTLVWQSPLVLWNDAVKKQPGSAVAWLILGEVSEKNGDAVNAVKQLENAKSLCRGVECFHVLTRLSDLYLQGGHPVEAEKSADELIQLAPDSAKGYLVKGQIKYQQGEISAAETEFSAGLRLDPTNPSALNALGNIFLATGRPAAALEKLKEAERHGTPSAELYYSLACAESMLQMREEALNHLGQALRLGYNKPEQLMTNSELSYLRSDPAFINLMQTYLPSIKFVDPERKL